MPGPTAPQEERRDGRQRSPLEEALERIDEIDEGLPEPEAVHALSTPAMLRVLDDPELKLTANAAVGAAIWRELVRREGADFARRALERRGLDPEAGGGSRSQRPSPERLAAGGRRISAGVGPRAETKDAGAGALSGVGGARQERPTTETSAKAARADADRPAQRRVGEEGLAQERGKDANGHVTYWVSDGAEVVQDARGWGVQMRTLDLHTRIHVRDPGDPNFSSIEDFGPYYGGPFNTSFAEMSGIVLHEQTHVEEVRAAWGGLWPDFAARVQAIRAASPGAAEGEYRALFEEFDQALFEQYFASGEEGARAKEWEHYHRQYDRLVGPPEGVSGGPGGARQAGARHGAEESAAAGMKEAAGVKRGGAGDDPVRPVVMGITSAIESGAAGASAINDYDSGVISYGIHQATLVSGALEAVLSRYVEGGGKYAPDFAPYMGAVVSKDEGLRDSGAFKALLRKAGRDPAMVAAQEDAFADGYYAPALRAAGRYGIRSPLGMLYDTLVQGGMAIVLDRTVAKLGGRVGQKGITEVDFLRMFNVRRRARLMALANHRKSRGDMVNARALTNSAKRCDEFEALLDAGNLALQGPLVIRGTEVEGLTEEDVTGLDLDIEGLV